MAVDSHLSVTEVTHLWEDLLTTPTFLEFTNLLARKVVFLVRERGEKNSFFSPATRKTPR